MAEPNPAAVRGFDAATSWELRSRWSSHERAYVNADGTFTTEFSVAPLNYRKPQGDWAPIDTSLVATGQGWRNTADAVDIRLAGRADAAELVRLGFDASHSLAFGLAGAAPAVPAVRGSVVTYPNVRPFVDIEFEILAGGEKETIVLHSPAAPHTFVFPMRLTGLTATVVQGLVVLADASGRRVATIPPGVMSDAAGATSTASYRLATHGGQPALEVGADPAWLADPRRHYPVRLDPSVESGAADSAMVVRGGSSSSGSTELLVGTVGGAATASYVKFTGLADRLRFHTIYGAQLQVVNFDSASCSSRAVTVHPVTQAWSAGSGFSYPGPPVGSALDDQSFAYGFIAFGQSQSACPARATLFDLGRRGRDVVQGWVNGAANNGLSLRASTSDPKAWKKFAGTATANPPRLYLTHSPYNAKYSIPKPVPEPPVLQNQAGKVKVTVTNLSAEAWSPSSYYLAYRAYRADTGASVTQQRAASLPTTVARNGRVTLDATIQPLPPGRYFLDFTMVRAGGLVFTDQQVPPGRIVLQVFDVPPVVAELHPPNGYQAPTLTPQLWARGVDVDAPPGSTLTFKFEYCEQTATGANVNCANSGYRTSQAWTVPAGALRWSKTYVWRAFVKDATTEVASEWVTLLTSVPQPEITSHVAGSPYGSQEREFDPQIGNFSTAALDASVTTVGPSLRMVRTYNSLDPRRDLAFGAGWVTQFDMRLVPDNDGSGNVVVTYPDGQQVRFGRNPDGTFAAPQGRTASLTVAGSNFLLADRAGMSYQFSGTGRLTKITDAGQRSIVLTYSTSTGLLAKATVSNSQSNTAGRSLTFAWSGPHVASVSTDAVDGTPLTWTYRYSGDLLTGVCPPAGAPCTAYEYTAGSHYRSAVLDSRPESYYRLGEAEGPATGSEIAVNLGKDAGTVKNVTLAQPGALAGTDNTAAGFNGTTSTVDLPKGMLKKNRDAAVEVWFKISAIQTGGPLLGYQDRVLNESSTTGMPLLYVGTDGRLRGQFRTGTATPITSLGTVNDNRWHHAVLSAMGATQTLFLDGVQVGTLAGTPEHSALTFNQIGAAYLTGTWPALPTGRRFFSGTIDEVAVYAHPLGPAAASAHFRLAAQADQLATVTLPSGRVAAEVSYDVTHDRVREYTDRHGGTWKIGTPAVHGGDTDLRRTIQVLDPADRPYLYEYDALAGRLLRSGSPTGLTVREEDRPDYRTPSPTPSPSPTEICNSPDPGDPLFCTVIPGSSGGPVFVGHALDGMAIRSFSYDGRGFQNVITNENGEQVTLGYDDRGNVTSRRTCRTATQCFTAYSTYPATVTNPFDPRNDLPTETRDARSASASDTTYRTSYTYTPTGELLTQINPDGGLVRHTYTTGAEAAVGGGATPPALPATTTDPRGAITRFAYFHNGDLARVTEPSGLVTTYTYDALGRRVSETETSATYPGGVTTTYAYDAQSRVTTTREPATTDAASGVRHQRVTTHQYDPDGNVVRTEVSDALGGDTPRGTGFDYDEHGRLARVTDAEGTETSYGYDRFGNRTSMVDANGNRYEFAFTARNVIAEVRLRDWHGDPPGTPSPGDYLVLNSYAYDFAGRMVRHTDAMGHRLEYAYFRDGLISTITLKNFRNPDGSTRDYVVESTTYDGAGNPVRQEAGDGEVVTQQVFNRAGQVESSTVDPGGLDRRTTYQYDLAGNVTRISWSGKSSNVPWPMPTTGQVVDYGYDLAGNRTRETVTGGGTSLVTTYAFDQRGLVTASTDPRGNVAGADPAPFTTTFHHDELERRVSTSGPAVAVESGGGAPQLVTPTVTVGYDTFDQVVATRDARGGVSRASYDRLGRAVTTSAPPYTPPGGTQAITPTTQTRHDALGNVTEVIDPRGNATRYTYDRLNRMTTRDEPASTSDERAVWTFTYTRTGEVLSVTDPTGARAETTYDDLDRRVTQTQVERKPVADTFTTRYSYDDAGNLTESTSPTGVKTTMAYDKAGDLVRTTSPAGVVTQYGFDLHGRQVRLSDGLGRTSRVDFDALGRVAAESDLAPTGATVRTQVYGYDPAGNLTSSTDALGRTTRYGYNALNLPVSQVEPVSATSSITTTYGYDAAGARTRYTDGRGNSTIYTVNSLGLPESVVEPSTPAHPAAADRTWTVSYDAAGNPVQLRAPGGLTRQRTYDAAGRLTVESGAGAQTGTAERRLGYDLADRLTTVSAPGGTNTYSYNDRGMLLAAGGPSGTASFAYNGDGQVTSRTDAAGTATYGYADGRLSTLAATGATQTLGYDASGQVRTVDYGSGRVRTYGFDDLGRVTSDVLRNAAGAPVAAISYEYDLDDHMTRKVTSGTAGAADNSYGYDQAGRLTSWTAGASTTGYGWDASGNRVQAGAKTASYDARNRLLADGDHTYTYTARGTLASKTSSGLTETYSFDAFDRLVGQGPQTYAYDGLDRLASRNGATFGYAGLAYEPVSDGVETYSRGPSDELLAVSRGAQKRVALTDEHGDLVAAFDPADATLPAVPDSTAYDPFGTVTASSGETGNVGFQGDWTDPATGQVDMGARWYDPASGTFDSRDSVTYGYGESILANRYTYAGGDPLAYSDPDGHWPSCGWCKKAINKVTSGVSRAWRATTGAVSRAWRATTSFVSTAWSYASSWARTAWHYAVSAYRYVASKVTSAVNWVYNKAKSAVRWVADKVSTAVRWVASKASAAASWARERAAAMRRAAVAAARRVTQAAKAAVSYAIKHNPLPAIKAALKPIYSGLKTVVSAAASLPAKVVSTVRNVVHDVARSVQVVYQKAVEAVGTVVEKVSKAAEAVSEFVQTHAATIAGIVAGAVVGIGCGVAIGWTGVGAVACGALAGAVGSVVHDLVEGGHSWKEMAGNALIGGVIGGLTGGLGSVAGAALRAGGRAAAGTVSRLAARFSGKADDFVDLYHGTSKAGAAAIRRDGIDLAAGRAHPDFGRGFYTTNSRRQARAWARKNPDGGAVLHYRVPAAELDNLSSLKFATADDAWERFVLSNRSGGPMHGYDTVEGPLLWNPDDALAGKTPVARGHQLSFHTDRAVEMLDRYLH